MIFFEKKKLKHKKQLSQQKKNHAEIPLLLTSSFDSNILNIIIGFCGKEIWYFLLQVSHSVYQTCYSNDYFSLCNLLCQKELEIPIVHIPSLSFLQSYFYHLKQHRLVSYGSFLRNHTLLFFIRRLQYQKLELTTAQQLSVEFLSNHLYWPLEIGIHFSFLKRKAQEHLHLQYYLRYAPSKESNLSILNEIFTTQVSDFNPCLIDYPLANWTFGSHTVVTQILPFAKHIPIAILEHSTSNFIWNILQLEEWIQMIQFNPNLLQYLSTQIPSIVLHDIFFWKKISLSIVQLPQIPKILLSLLQSQVLDAKEIITSLLLTNQVSKSWVQQFISESLLTIPIAQEYLNHCPWLLLFLLEQKILQEPSMELLIELMTKEPKLFKELPHQTKKEAIVAKHALLQDFNLLHLVHHKYITKELIIQSAVNHMGKPVCYDLSLQFVLKNISIYDDQFTVQQLLRLHPKCALVFIGPVCRRDSIIMKRVLHLFPDFFFIPWKEGITLPTSHCCSTSIFNLDTMIREKQHIKVSEIYNWIKLWNDPYGCLWRICYTEAFNAGCLSRFVSWNGNLILPMWDNANLKPLIEEYPKLIIKALQNLYIEKETYDTKLLLKQMVAFYGNMDNNAKREVIEIMCKSNINRLEYFVEELEEEVIIHLIETVSPFILFAIPNQLHNQSFASLLKVKQCYAMLFE